MSKKVRVILFPEAEEVYNYLEKENAKIEKMILKALQRKIKFIKSDVHYGKPVSKKFIPKEYKEKYGITNLFRVELPNFWRMLYTLTNNDTKVEIIAFILDIMNHDKYNKKFGYKKK